MYDYNVKFFKKQDQAKSDRLDVNKHKKQDFNSVSTPQIMEQT